MLSYVDDGNVLKSCEVVGDFLEDCVIVSNGFAKGRSGIISKDTKQKHLNGNTLKMYLL